MKKLAMSSVLGVIIAASTSMTFGQGDMVFGSASRTVTDGSSADDGWVATFVWSATSTTAPLEGTSGTFFYSYSAAWADLENLPSGWQFGIDAGTGSNVIARPVNNLGSFSYDTGAAFPLSGSSGPGEAISIQAIAWETDGGLYNTLAAAETADAPVGWSSVFQYTLGSGPPAAPPAETVVPQFAIGPEPTTMALIGLGGFSLLFLRRSRGNETLINHESRQTGEARV